MRVTCIGGAACFGLMMGVREPKALLSGIPFCSAVLEFRRSENRLWKVEGGGEWVLMEWGFCTAFFLSWLIWWMRLVPLMTEGVEVISQAISRVSLGSWLLLLMMATRDPSFYWVFIETTVFAMSYSSPDPDIT